MQRLSGRDNTGLLGRMLRPTSSLVHMTPDDVAFDLLAGDLGLDPLNDSTSESQDEGAAPTQKSRRKRRRPTNAPRKDAAYYRQCTYGRFLEENEFNKTMEEDGVCGYQEFVDRFRLPWPAFVELEQALHAKGHFLNKRQTVIPPRFRLWSALRQMGRGMAVTDERDHSRMSARSIRRAFAEFIHAVGDELFEEFVYPPETDDEVQKAMGLYAASGADGVICSIDVVHLPWGMCPMGLYNVCAGRYGHPTLGFECAVTHDTRFVSCSAATAGSISDKTIVKVDPFVTAVRGGKYAHVPFELRDLRGGVSRFLGPVFICDGGYHLWRELQTGYGPTTDLIKQAWTAKHESLRKDVECSFGILKRRFRILKIPCELRRASDIAALFRTALVLHNLCLKHNGGENVSHSWRSDNFPADYGQFDSGVVGSVVEWPLCGYPPSVVMPDTDLTDIGVDKPIPVALTEKDEGPRGFEFLRDAMAKNHWYRTKIAKK